MKTVTIPVWVKENSEADLRKNYGFFVDKDQSDLYQLKAKLIIEIPEKKIEITESEFDKINKALLIKEGYLHPCQFSNLLKKELGF